MKAQQPAPYQDPRNANRVLDALRVYAGQEALAPFAGILARNSPVELMQKYQHYQQLYNTFKKGANATERISLRYIKHELRRLKLEIRTHDFRVRFTWPLVARLRVLVGSLNPQTKWHTKTLQEEQRTILRSRNLGDLQNELKRAGFTLSLEGPLDKMTALNLPTFHLRYADPLHCPNTDYLLHFQKLPGSDYYYFDRFDAVVRPTLQSVLKNDTATFRQAFSVLEGVVTAPEAAHLVHGRAICRQEEGEERWLVLDRYPTSGEVPVYKTYSFDLEASLRHWPIQQLENPKHRDALVQILKKGSLAEVTLLVNGKGEKYRVQAVPQYTTLRFLDKQDRPVPPDVLMKTLPNAMLEKLRQRAGEEQVIDLRVSQAGKLSR